MNLWRTIRVHSRRKHALKAFQPDSANLHITLNVQMQIPVLFLLQHKIKFLHLDRQSVHPGHMQAGSRPQREKQDAKLSSNLRGSCYVPNNPQTFQSQDSRQDGTKERTWCGQGHPRASCRVRGRALPGRQRSLCLSHCSQRPGRTPGQGQTRRGVRGPPSTAPGPSARSPVNMQHQMSATLHLNDSKNSRCLCII